jgi:hypothetical protein
MAQRQFWTSLLRDSVPFVDLLVRQKYAYPKWHGKSFSLLCMAKSKTKNQPGSLL